MVDSIEKLHEKVVKLRKWTEDLVIFFKERKLIEELYSKDLERLALKLNPQIFPDISENIKKALTRTSTSSAKFAASISEKIVTSLNKLLTTQAAMIREPLIDGSKNEKRKIRLLQKIHDAKGKYWESCSHCEQVAVALDAESSIGKKEKLLMKLLSNKTNLDIFFKNYVETIEKYSRYRKTYLMKTKKTISIIQTHEQELLEALNQTSKSYFEFEGLSEFELRLKSTSEDTSLLLIYPERYFEAYEGSHPLFKNIGIHSAPHLHASILELSGVDLGTSSAVESLYRGEIGNIVAKAWEGIELNSQEYLQFNAIIKEHVGRKAWSWSMNQKRTQGIFKIDTKGFSLISELMVAVLNECERCQDITVSKNCIILSQTFYKHSDKGKVYLQTSILTHTLWENEIFWAQVVNSAISEEIKNQVKDDLSSDHMKSLVFCQLVSFGNIMMSFKVHEDVITSLFKEIASNHHFNEHEVLEIMVIAN